MPPMDGVSTPFEARHRALLEAIPDLLLRLRADGTYLEVAGDLSRLANPPETVPGANVRDLLDPDIADQLLAGVRQALVTGELATVNYTLRTYGGEQCEFELRIAPAGARRGRRDRARRHRRPRRRSASCRSHARGSSRPATTPAAGSSATSTTARSSASSASRSTSI